MRGRQKKMRRGVWLVLGLVSCWLHASDPRKHSNHYNLERWTVDDGLPQASVFSLTADESGFLWFGTQEGIVRFDGHTMEVFDKVNTPALTDHYARALLFDDEGRLWVGLDAHGLIRRDHDGWHRVEGMEDKQIRVLMQSSDGVIHVGTNRNGLYRYSQGLFVQVSSLPGLSDDSIWGLEEDLDGHVWAASGSGGLFRVKGGQVEQFTVETGLPSNRLRALMLDAAGRLWVGAWDGGVAIYDGVSFQQVPVRGGRLNTVKTILQDATGNVWVGSYSTGLWCKQVGQNHFTRLPALEGVGVISLLEDPEGGLFVGSSNGGLFRLNNGLVNMVTGPGELGMDTVWCTLRDRTAPTVWLGSSRGLLTYHHEIVERPDYLKPLEESNVRALFQDEEGDLWIGTQGDGLARLSGGRLDWMERNTLRGKVIRSIAADLVGAIWIGTERSGLFRMEGEEAVQVVSTGVQRATGVRALHLDEAGALWIGTDGQGLVRYFDGSFSRIDSKGPTAQASILSFHEDEDGVIWFGTNGSGLGRIDPRHIFLYGSEHGLPTEDAFAIVEDRTDRFWVSHNQGLYSVSKAELNAVARGELQRVNARPLGPRDGLRNPERNAGGLGGDLTPDGDPIFAGMGGAAVVDVSAGEEQEELPRIVFTKVTADGEQHSAEDGLLLDSGVKYLEIHYTAPSFDLAKRLVFSYRLIGYSDQWQDAGSRRAAYFTGLSHGDYSLEVRAKIRGQEQLPSRAVYHFSVAPRFYQSAWFYWLLLPLGLVILLAVARVRVRTTRARQLALKQMVQQRTKELETINEKLRSTQESLVHAAHEAGMAEIAGDVLHNVGNGLNTVSTAATILEDTIRHDQALKFIGNLSRLFDENRDNLGEFFTTNPRAQQIPDALRVLNDLMRRARDQAFGEIKDIQDQIRRLHEVVFAQQTYAGKTSFSELVDLEQLIQDVLKMNQRQLKEGEVMVRLNLERLEPVRGQKTRLMQVFTNLVKNACESMGGKSLASDRILQIESGMDSETVRVSIIDSGVGFAEEDSTKIFQPTYAGAGSGVSLHYCANAVKEMGGELVVLSRGIGKGARFTVALPRSGE